MSKAFVCLFALCAVGTVSGLSAAAQPGANIYVLEKTVPLPGEGGWDYVTGTGGCQRINDTFVQLFLGKPTN